MSVTTIKGWFALVAAVVSIAGSIVGCTLWMAHKFQAQDERIMKVESAVKVLNSQQPEQLKNLVKDLMAEEEHKRVWIEGGYNEETIPRFDASWKWAKDGVQSQASKAAPEYNIRKSDPTTPTGHEFRKLMPGVSADAPAVEKPKE